MGILIRADAGGPLGSGHVMRMIALAQACCARGLETGFVVASCPGKIADRVRAEVDWFREIPTEDLGGDADAAMTIAIGREAKASWIVVDGYQFGSGYHGALRRAGFRVLAVDDFGMLSHWEVDAVLNQNLGARAADYRLADPSGTCLAGVGFALIRREFLGGAERPTRGSEGGHPRILVTLGGTDPDNVTLRVVRALGRQAIGEGEIRVVLGAGNVHRESIESEVARLPVPATVVHGVENMASEYGWADGVISASGSTCYEWLHLRKPGAVVVIAENQQRIGDALRSRGLAEVFEQFQDLETDEGSSRLARFVGSLTHGRSDGNHGLPVVDGKGAARVAALLDGTLRITVATAEGGWLESRLDDLVADWTRRGHQIALASSPAGMAGGDVLVLLSYWGIVPPEVLERYSNAIVVHASDLPAGRGWSPLSWQILEGRNVIPVCLLEAADKVDRGDVYRRTSIEFEGHELVDELRREVTNATCRLCDWFVSGFPASVAEGLPQSGEPTYYPRRTPKDSELDPAKSLADQFNLLRIVDNESYPAFFEHLGCRYELKISKASPPTSRDA